MKQKVLYMILAACLLLVNASDIFAKGKKKVEDPEISKLKGKIENVMQKVDANVVGTNFEKETADVIFDVVSMKDNQKTKVGELTLVLGMLAAEAFHERASLLKLSQGCGMEPHIALALIYLPAQGEVGLQPSLEHGTGLAVERGHQDDAQHIEVNGQGIQKAYHLKKKKSK